MSIGMAVWALGVGLHDRTVVVAAQEGGRGRTEELPGKSRELIPGNVPGHAACLYEVMLGHLGFLDRIL